MECILISNECTRIEAFELKFFIVEYSLCFRIRVNEYLKASYLINIHLLRQF